MGRLSVSAPRPAVTSRIHRPTQSRHFHYYSPLTHTESKCPRTLYHCVPALMALPRPRRRFGDVEQWKSTADRGQHFSPPKSQPCVRDREKEREREVTRFTALSQESDILFLLKGHSKVRHIVTFLWKGTE